VTHVDPAETGATHWSNDDVLFGFRFDYLVMKYMLIQPVANWAWWQVSIPFALAIAWWAWADSSGYTKRKAMDKETCAQRGPH